MQRKPEQSICTVLPLLQTALKRVALVACTVPHCRPLLMPWARLAADAVDMAGLAGPASPPAPAPA
ncbi:glycerophosphodiester phosphodiesterase, partial [Xanthomonas perforans]